MFRTLIALTFLLALTSSAAVDAQPPLGYLELAWLDEGDGFLAHGKESFDYLAPGAGLGDVNGDGWGDVALSARIVDAAGRFQAGEVYVVYGGSSFPAELDLTTLDGTNGLTILGAEELQVSQVLPSSGPCDLNGDGYPEIPVAALVGGPGQVYVVYGGPELPATLDLRDLDPDLGFRIDGVDLGDQCCIPSCVGDVNGDGLDDLGLGATNADGVRGAGYVVFGRQTFPEIVSLAVLGSDGMHFRSVSSKDGLGGTTAAGDVNGDGIDDILLGASRAWVNGDRDGEAYVVFGSVAPAERVDLGELTPDDGVVLFGPGPSTATSLAGVGDFDGDGIDDIAIADSSDTSRSDGVVFLVYGRQSWPDRVELRDLDGVNGAVILGDEFGGGDFGQSVSGVGDLDGDGFADLGATCPNGSPFGRLGAGKVYVIYGRPRALDPIINITDLNGRNGFAIHGERAGDKLDGISWTGDFDGDGLDDLLFGSDYIDDGEKERAGGVYVVSGNPTPEIPWIPGGVDPVTDSGDPVE